MYNENLLRDQSNRSKSSPIGILGMPKKKRSPTDNEGTATTNNNEGTSSAASDPNAIQPRNNDVLFGRGDSINRHPGNKKFRELVDSHKRVYLASRFKQEKRMIADSIMAAIAGLSPPGRFLAKDSATAHWKMVEDSRAREKTLQALREKARSVRTLAEAREPPRQSWLPTETSAFPPIQPNPPQASLLSIRGLPPVQTSIAPAAWSGSTGLRPAHADPLLVALSGSTGAPPGQQSNPVFAAIPGTRGPPVNGALAAALSSQVHQPATFPSYANPFSLAQVPGPAPGPAPAASIAAQISLGDDEDIGIPPPPRPPRPTGPLAPPPSLPTSVRPRRGQTAVQQGLSSRLLSDQERAGLLPTTQERPVPGSSVAPLEVSMTPRPQVPIAPMAGSPVSAGTFDALQRVAFPESPVLDYFLFGGNNSLSPRRLAPGANSLSPRRLPPSRDAVVPQSAPLQFRRNLSPSSTMPPPASQTPRQRPLQASSRQQTPFSSQLQAAAPQATHSPRGQLPPRVDMLPQTSPHAPGYLLPQQQTQPSYSPIRISHEEPTPPLAAHYHQALDPSHADFLASPSMFHLLSRGAMAAPTPPPSTPRRVALPQAVLAPRVRRQGGEDSTSQPPADYGRPN